MAATTQNKERRSVSRQFHRKSRNGCLTCRKRRVRCNLQSPTCANCHRRNEHCSFEQQERDLKPTRFSNMSTGTYPWYRGDIPVVCPGFTLIAPVPHDEQCTRQVVTDQTASPITWAMEKTFFLSWLSSLEKGVFSRELTHQASRFSYVRRTIIALSTLHEWCQSSSRSDLYASAYQHHIEASKSFRNSQAEVNETNWIAVLMFGIGVIIFQFATVMKTFNGADDYLQLLHVLRNSFDLAAELGPFLQTSLIMQLTGAYLRRLELHLDEDTWNAVLYLDSLDYPEDTTDETRCACLQSITALKEWVIKVDGHPGNWRDFIDWPAAISEQYLSALSHRHPVALVVFVYWCAIMHRSPKRWYMVGWANRAAIVAMGYLGEEWNHVLEFPRAILASEPKGPESFQLALTSG
ncbi:hypothetical protein F4677DRAFT_457902 [Hypoxylon crocopeplum]|nr:hypothetical protein F4677DRAFT_457902 [Hypoxylon crocopeplum]